MGWIDELQMKTAIKKGTPSSFIIGNNTDLIFLVVGASFDLASGSLVYKTIRMHDRVALDIPELQFRTKYRYIRSKGVFV